MGLVDYSDTDSSDNDNSSEIKSAVIPKSSSQTNFRKIVDKSNPGKIRVSLPQASLIEGKDEELREREVINEPPNKRARCGEGVFSGFNSLLPAPKRSGPGTANSQGTTTNNRILGSGVNLMTGNLPGFSRESHTKGEHKLQESARPLPIAGGSGDDVNTTTEVKMTTGKPLMFKPLSVSNKPTKKKKAACSQAVITTPSSTLDESDLDQKHNQPPKISLFCLNPGTDSSISLHKEDYQSIKLDITDSKNWDSKEEEKVESLPQDNIPPPSPLAPAPFASNSNSLSSIADSLHLSSSERRQLFGRQNGKKSGINTTATNIINFNTDKEYSSNEEFRATGEQIVHNPVRSIAPGKHSLKQLVNAVQSQKDALEESFAKGKSNRAEASSRYGW